MTQVSQKMCLSDTDCCDFFFSPFIAVHFRTKINTLTSNLKKEMSTSSNLSDATIHSCRFKLHFCKTIIQTSDLVFQESTGSFLPSSARLLCARSTVEDAASLSPSEFRFVDPIVATCWFITGRFLIAQLAKPSTETEKAEVRNDLFQMASALFSWGTTYPRGSEYLVVK